MRLCKLLGVTHGERFLARHLRELLPRTIRHNQNFPSYEMHKR